MTHRTLSAPPAGEDARERAIRLLTDAYAYDVIDDVEFERRLALLGLNPSADAIHSVVSDLPAPPGVERMMAAGLRPVLKDKGRIRGFMSQASRKGSWRVPQQLTVKAFMAEVKLDLRYAAIPADCVIHVSAMMANVSLIVPPGMHVDFGVSTIMASASCDVQVNPRAQSGATIRVEGRAVMSEVSVRVRGYREDY